MAGVIMHARSLVSVAQFETGLTGTPYATGRHDIAMKLNKKYRNVRMAASQSNPTDQSDQIN
jgi:hypothetical protein